jgi:signal peptidase I
MRRRVGVSTHASCVRPPARRPAPTALVFAACLLLLSECRAPETDAKTGREIREYRLPSASMEPTIASGAIVRVLIFPSAQDALAEVHHEDIVAHRYPPDTTKQFLKRVVAVPGDTIAMRDGRLWRNGHPVDEPYAWHADPKVDPVDDAFGWQRAYLRAGDDPRQYRASRNTWGPLVVPHAAYFVLGDNRDNSLDSRYWGFARATDILGLAFVDARR